MPERYRHTQIGYVNIFALLVGIVLLVMGGYLTGSLIVWSLVPIFAILLVWSATLTVVIDDKELRFWFGPGGVGKSIPLTDIVNCEVVRNKWYYGWGIHRTPSGWLYNVSGMMAVEITLRNGKKLRIGTDEPGRLRSEIILSIPHPRQRDVKF